MIRVSTGAPMCGIVSVVIGTFVCVGGCVSVVTPVCMFCGCCESPVKGFPGCCCGTVCCWGGVSYLTLSGGPPAVGARRGIVSLGFGAGGVGCVPPVLKLHCSKAVAAVLVEMDAPSIARP